MVAVAIEASSNESNDYEKYREIISSLIRSDTEEFLAVKRNSEGELLRKLARGAQGAPIEAMLNPQPAGSSNDLLGSALSSRGISGKEGHRRR